LSVGRFRPPNGESRQPSGRPRPAITIAIPRRASSGSCWSTARRIGPAGAAGRDAAGGGPGPMALYII